MTGVQTCALPICFPVTITDDWDVNANVHKIYQGQDKDTNKFLTISTWQSIYQMLSRWFAQFDFVIGDEAHQFKAKSLTTIMTGLTNAKYRIGTTGTLDGTKTHRLVLEGLFGSVRKVTTTKELMDAKHLADFQIKCLLLRHSESICQAAKNFTYQQEIEYLVLNDNRTSSLLILQHLWKGTPSYYINTLTNTDEYSMTLSSIRSLKDERYFS